MPFCFCGPVPPRRKKRHRMRLIATTLRRIRRCTRSFIRPGTCRIIRRSAAATTQTVTLPRSNTSTARSMRGGGKTGSIFSYRPRRSSETGIILTAEITFARQRRPVFRLTRSIASHWEAPHEIRIGEWLPSGQRSACNAAKRSMATMSAKSGFAYLTAIINATHATVILKRGWQAWAMEASLWLMEHNKKLDDRGCREASRDGTRTDNGPGTFRGERQ